MFCSTGNESLESLSGTFNIRQSLISYTLGTIRVIFKDLWQSSQILIIDTENANRLNAI